MGARLLLPFCDTEEILLVEERCGVGSLVERAIDAENAALDLPLSKKVVNLALKYTHEIRPEWYESLNYLKLHYFPRHIGHSRKINSSYCSFTSLDSFFKKKITDFDLIFDEPEFLYFLLVR